MNKSRLDEIREHNNPIQDSSGIESDLLGWITGSGQEFQEVETVLTYVYSEIGVAGRARHVYEVYLDPEVEEIVPMGVMKVAAYRGLDVTAIESTQLDGEIEQTVLLLEPSDTEKYPR